MHHYPEIKSIITLIEFHENSQRTLMCGVQNKCVDGTGQRYWFGKKRIILHPPTNLIGFHFRLDEVFNIQNSQAQNTKIQKKHT